MQLSCGNERLRWKAMQVGSYAAVRDHRAHAGDWAPIYFFDEKWTYVNTLLY